MKKEGNSTKAKRIDNNNTNNNNNNNTTSPSKPKKPQAIFSILNVIIYSLNKNGIDIANLFENSVSEGQLSKLHDSLNEAPEENLNSSPKVIGGLLKYHLSNLEPKLLNFTKDTYQELMSAQELTDSNSRNWCTKELLEEVLERERKKSLILLLSFLNQHCKRNNLSTNRISQIFAPLIIESPKGKKNQALEIKAIESMLNDF